MICLLCRELGPVVAAAEGLDAVFRAFDIAVVAGVVLRLTYLDEESTSLPSAFQVPNSTTSRTRFP